MGEPRVSVVLTNYNGEKYVGQAIRSVLSQTMPDWELIIVDDASSDGSLEVIRSFLDERIRLIVNEQNSQVSYSHNRANKLCRGRYIAALDNDDLWEPDKLEKQTAYMETHPETGACFTLLRLIDEDGNPYQDPGTEAIFEIGNMSREAWLHELLTNGNHLANDSSLIRREVMDEIGENNLCLLQLHDYEMWVKIARRHELYVLQEPLMSYRKRREGGTISSVNEESRRRTLFEFAWVIGQAVTEMEDGLFRRVFREELICPDLNTPEAVRCEKAMLLMSDRLVTPCWDAAFRLLTDLLQREETRELLRERYGFTQKDVYRKTGALFSNDQAAYLELSETKKMLEYREKEAAEYRNSFSWRVTAPLRSVTGAMKKTGQRFSPAKRILDYLLHDTPRENMRRVSGRLQRPFRNRAIVTGMTVPEEELAEQRSSHFPEELKISLLVPLYNTPEAFLREMIQSVQEQTYGNWELCLADGSDGDHGEVEGICRELAASDARIRYRKLEENRGISENTNACIEMATGEYIALFDHDDLLLPSALYEVMRAVNEEGADFIYTDEAVFASPRREKLIANHFKPDFAPDDLLSNNYICHLSAFSRELLERAGRFRKEFDGSQDHDLILRLTGEARKVVHVPKVLYLWRSHAASVASDISAKTYAVDAGRAAVRDFVRKNEGTDAQVESVPAYPTLYHIRRPLREETTVEVIVDASAEPGDWQALLSGLSDPEQGIRMSLLLVSRSEIAVPDGVRDRVRTLKSEAVSRAERLDEAARQARGEFLLFLEEGLEPLNGGWIGEMLSLAQREKTGAVGGKIFFGNRNAVRHAGLTLGLGSRGLIGRNHIGFSRSSGGYFGQLAVVEEMSAVSCECMMIRRNKYLEAGGFSAEYRDSLFDADLCLQLGEAGYRQIFTPFAELRGGSSRRFSLNFGTEWESYSRDAEVFRSRWGEKLKRGDRFYNANLSLKYADYRPRLMRRNQRKQEGTGK